VKATNQRRKIAMIGCLAAAMVFGGGFLAVSSFGGSEDGEEKPQNWSSYDERHPWFDGVYWDWFRDMFNQTSLKPQEVGTIQEFPLDSVPRTGVEDRIDPQNMGQRYSSPKNPVAKTAESVAQGRVMYETYCGPCHGNDGKATTSISENWFFAPNLVDLNPELTESRIYNQIRYGGAVMPPYAIQTSQKDRWNIVNYMKSKDFGKGK